MNAPKIDELMVQIKDYASVSSEASLLDAVEALEKARERADRRRFKHRAVLVIDEQEKIVGKVRPIEVLDNLEPGYGRLGPLNDPARLSREKIKNMITERRLWEKPFRQTCRDAALTPVKEIMHVFQENEYIHLDAPIEEAIHQMIIGRRMSLLVEKDGQVVGVLRLTDIYSEVCLIMKEGRPPY
ncbi:MAG: CBS domain-containing protein [Pseudomonadota bacterium]